MMTPRSLDLESLRAFVAIVDLGGFSVAAERLCRTQSAVSLQLKRLEDTLGQTLLRRAQGRLEGLTAEGETLLGYARQMLRLNDEAYAAVSCDERPGGLQLGLPEELMESVFPVAMTSFRAVYPRQRLQIVADQSTRLRTLFAEGKLDLALVKDCEPERGADGVLIWQEPLVWMVGASYRDSLDRAVADHEGRIPLALFGENCAFRMAATRALAQAGLHGEVGYSGSSVTGLCHAVMAGIGLTALPRSLFRAGLALPAAVAGKSLPVLPNARLWALYQPDNRVAARLAAALGEAMAMRAQAQAAP